MKQYQVIANNLTLINRQIPSVQDNEILVKVAAIGLNRADLLGIEGMYGKEINSFPGIEFSGVNIRNGKKVCGLVPSGAFAEYVAIKASHSFEIADNLDLELAACLPEAFATSYMALFVKGEIHKNKNILIHGGSSGIGHLMMQIAKIFGNKVFISASSNKISQLKHLNADYIFDYHLKDWPDYLKQNNLNVDILVDILGGEYVKYNIKSLSHYGRYILLALMTGRDAELPLGSLLMKNIRLEGATLKSQPDDIKSQYIKCSFEKFLPFINTKIKPIIAKSFSFSQLESAILYMKKRSHIGKIIIKV